MAALGIGATVDTPPTLMAPEDYHAGERALQARARLALSRCRDADGAGREICRAQVRAEARVWQAELRARYHGTVEALREVESARARAEYDVAKARCRVSEGIDRAACLRAAREARTRATATAGAAT